MHPLILLAVPFAVSALYLLWLLLGGAYYGLRPSTARRRNTRI